jgi:hypothetical protein
MIDLLNRIKKIISNYLLSKKTKSQYRKSKIIPFSKSKKAALLFDATSLEAISSIKILLKFFLKKNIDVFVLGFVNMKKNSSFHLSTIHINYYNLSEINFFGFPKSKKLNDFASINYDFLINLSMENTFSLKYLSLITKSNFKIGVYNSDDNEIYDFLLVMKIKSIEHLVEQTIFYLEQINNNNEK